MFTRTGAGDEDDEQAALTASLAEAMPRQLAFDAGDSAVAERQLARAPYAAYVGGVSLHISVATQRPPVIVGRSRLLGSLPQISHVVSGQAALAS